MISYNMTGNISIILPYPKGHAINEINKLTNDQLKQLLVFKNEDALFINKTYVSRSYLEYLDYKNMQEANYKKVVDREFLHIIT